MNVAHMLHSIFDDWLLPSSDGFRHWKLKRKTIHGIFWISPSHFQLRTHPNIAKHDVEGVYSGVVEYAIQWTESVKHRLHLYCQLYRILYRLQIHSSYTIFGDLQVNSVLEVTNSVLENSDISSKSPLSFFNGVNTHESPRCQK